MARSARAAKPGHGHGRTIRFYNRFLGSAAHGYRNWPTSGIAIQGPRQEGQGGPDPEVPTRRRLRFAFHVVRFFKLHRLFSGVLRAMLCKKEIGYPPLRVQTRWRRLARVRSRRFYDGPMPAKKPTLQNMIEDKDVRTIHYIYNFGDGCLTVSYKTRVVT